MTHFIWEEEGYKIQQKHVLCTGNYLHIAVSYIKFKIWQQITKKKSAQGFVLTLSRSPLHVSPIVTHAQKSQACYKSVSTHPVPFTVVPPHCYLL